MRRNRKVIVKQVGFGQCDEVGDLSLSAHRVMPVDRFSCLILPFAAYPRSYVEPHRRRISACQKLLAACMRLAGVVEPKTSRVTHALRV